MEDETSYESWSEQKLRAYLSNLDIHQAAGFAIEVYRERFPISSESIPVLERFLFSNLLDNRDAAIVALVQYGERMQYVVDALVLHFRSREDGTDMPATYSSLRALQRMAELGSTDAARAVALLDSDPYVQRMFP